MEAKDASFNLLNHDILRLILLSAVSFERNQMVTSCIYEGGWATLPMGRAEGVSSSKVAADV